MRAQEGVHGVEVAVLASHCGHGLCGKVLTCGIGPQFDTERCGLSASWGSDLGCALALAGLFDSHGDLQ